MLGSKLWNLPGLLRHMGTTQGPPEPHHRCSGAMQDLPGLHPAVFCGPRGAKVQTLAFVAY